jgi:hypothetical protein
MRQAFFDVLSDQTVSEAFSSIFMHCLLQGLKNKKTVEKNILFLLEFENLQITNLVALAKRELLK